jgi:hypothetical protein
LLGCLAIALLCRRSSFLSFFVAAKDRGPGKRAVKINQQTVDFILQQGEDAKESDSDEEWVANEKAVKVRLKFV